MNEGEKKKITEHISKAAGENHKPPQTIWGKIWFFIWESNSIWSWIVNIILAFLIIKFIAYPVLGLGLGTALPIVAVVSGSMEHDGNFDTWWNSECCNNGGCGGQGDIYASYVITKEQFDGFRFSNGFNKGDLMILKRASDVSLGDTVVFVAPDPKLKDPIIHRVVGISDSSITTKGDHNCNSAGFEVNLPQDALVGEAIARIPFLGWIKIGFVELINLFRGI